MPRRKPLILVVDDDPRLLRMVTRTLEMEGYTVATATDGRTALQLCENEQPALVLLDIMMPEMDGFEVCEHIRDFSSVPIIMLTAKGQSEDVVHGLDIGADDYVVKPFGADELLARINTVLRRTRYPEEMPQPPFVCDELRVDFGQHRVTIGEVDVGLTPTEYRLLCLLASNAGKVLTQEQILAQVWGAEYVDDSHVLQVAVARLRKKIGDAPGKSRYIHTRSGVGYTFRTPQARS